MVSPLRPSSRDVTSYDKSHVTSSRIFPYWLRDTVEGSQSRQSAKLFLQSSELGLPQSLTRRRVRPPPLRFWGEGQTRWREKGWGSPNSDEGTHSVVLFIYIGTLCGVMGWGVRCGKRGREYSSQPVRRYWTADHRQSCPNMIWLLHRNKCLAKYGHAAARFQLVRHIFRIRFSEPKRAFAIMTFLVKLRRPW